MEVRRITEKDYEQFCRISAASYVWGLSFDEEKFPKHKLYGAFDDDGALCGEMECMEFDCNFGGSFLPSIGIGGVATMPEKRRKGSIRLLFNEAERLSAENGWAMGFLYPFSIQYYRKFGYARVQRNASVTVDFANLGSFARNCDVELYEGQCLDDLLFVHNKAAEKYSLMAKRSDSRYFCKEPLKECDYTYLWRYADGRPGAYASFKVDRKAQVLSVSSIFWLDRQAMNGIIGFLRNYDGVATTLRLEKLPIDSELLAVIEETDGPQFSLSHGAAGRIYNLPMLLENNSYPEQHGAFRLKCTDTLAVNNGIFEVEYQNGRALVTRSKSDKFDISLDAPAAAKLLLSGSGFTARTASYLDGVELNGEAASFFEAFPKRSTHFNDGF